MDRIVEEGKEASDLNKYLRDALQPRPKTDRRSPTVDVARSILFSMSKSLDKIDKYLLPSDIE